MIGLIKKLFKKTIEQKPIKKGHLVPNMFRYELYYSKTYANLNKCNKCGCIGMSEDLRKLKPCYICGCRVSYFGSGIWKEKGGVIQWVYPECSEEKCR